MKARILMGMFMAAGLAACVNAPRSINPDYQLFVPDVEYKRRLEDWFNCDECMNGQLRRIQELGNAAVPDLIGGRRGAGARGQRPRPPCPLHANSRCTGRAGARAGTNRG